MFREKLKNDLNGISPDEELLNKVTKAMQEEAAKPRQPKRIAVMRFAGMAAAVCMIAVGAGALYGGDVGVSTETAADYSGKSGAEPVAYELEPQEGYSAAEAGNAVAEAAEMPVTPAAETEPEAMDVAQVEEFVTEETATEAEEPAPMETETEEKLTTTEETTPPVSEEAPDENVSATNYMNSIYAAYMDNEVYIDGMEHYEIICTVLDYTAGNPDKKADPAFTSANIESFSKYGLSLCYETEGGKRIRVLVDELRSYVQADGGFYIFEGESKDKVMSHFGTAQLAIHTTEAVFKGNDIVLSEEEAYEIWNILFDYAESKPHKSLNTEYMEVDFDSVCQNGLYFYARGYQGEKAFIYIDSNVSYAVVNRDYYIFEGEHRDRVLGYFAEYGTIENMYVTPKVLSGCRVLYKGALYDVTLEEVSEVNSVIEEYMAENTHRITNKVITDEEIGEYEESGLSLTLYYTDGSEICVYADDENAYICGEDTYLLGPNIYAQVIAYAEAVKLKKTMGL